MRIPIALAAALLIVAACGRGPSAPPVAGSTAHLAALVSSPSADPTAQRTHAWLTFAACMRTHGADLPDPSFDQDGNPVWSVNPKTQPQAALAACVSSLPVPSVQGTGAGKSARPPTAAELATLTRFAQCMRQQGMPDFPDPNPQTGDFGTIDKTNPSLQAASRACQDAGIKK